MVTHVGSKIIGTPTLGLRGLVLWLKFDEGSGTAANDSSLYNNHGVINGATWTTGKFGSALKFNGSGAYVNVADSPSLKIGESSGTWVFWVCCLGDTGNEQTILKHGTTTPSIRPYLDPGTMPSYGKMQLRIEYERGTADWGTEFLLELNKWYHVAITFDGSSLNVYLNGVRSDYAMATSSLGRHGGDITVSEATNSFWGYIDNVLIYNRAISEDEIKLLYYNRIGAVLSKSVS